MKTSVSHIEFVSDGLISGRFQAENDGSAGPDTWRVDVTVTFGSTRDFPARLLPEAVETAALATLNQVVHRMMQRIADR